MSFPSLETETLLPLPLSPTRDTQLEQDNTRSHHHPHWLRIQIPWVDIQPCPNNPHPEDPQCFVLPTPSSQECSQHTRTPTHLHTHTHLKPSGVLCPATRYSALALCPVPMQHCHPVTSTIQPWPNPWTRTLLHVRGFSSSSGSQIRAWAPPMLALPDLKVLASPLYHKWTHSHPAHRDPSPVLTFRSRRGASTLSLQLRSTVCTAPSALRHSPRTSLPRKTGISGQVGKRFS